ncbi:F-box/kelch-repeat protein At5g26960 [Diospyros lotus]|uniref:F-box/kelch-repeat protein At5g26960 n=1 Tax=Diospyros lotus TaxID=55363 RepID=UPI00224F5B10|nr:F-box/kelch-repeat protein At5g26960 [Diospyros lotus]
MSETCNSRHFSWLMKSCFPNPQHHHHHDPHIHRVPASATASQENHLHLHQQPPAISSLPDDLLLECLSRVPHSALPSAYLVCRRWARLLDSPAFIHLRRRHSRLRHTLFAVAVTPSELYTATLRLGYDASWKTASLAAENDVASLPEIFHGLSMQARLAAIGRKIYIIGRTSMIRLDTWTGTVAAKSATVFPRKKFAAAAVGGRVYVAGGAFRTSAVEEYDPSCDRWRVVSDAPRRRYGCIGTAVDGVFYVIGGLKIGSYGEDISRAAGAEAHVYASSMDLYDVEAGAWLRSQAVPGGGCLVAACASEGFVYVLASHAVELSFWRFDGRRKGGGAFGEWNRIKSPPVMAQVSALRFSCVAVGGKVVVIQVVGSMDELWRRGGGRRGVKGGLVMVYDGAAGEWSRAADLPEVMPRAACVSVEC